MTVSPRTRTYARGRYGQFLLVIEDEVRTLNGNLVYACRACGAPVEPPKKVYCSGSCRKDFQQVFRMTDWRYIRRQAVRRDDRTCQECGASPSRKDWAQGVFLEVDHVEPVRVAPWREFDLENLRTLCRECHGEHGGDPRVWRRREANRQLEDFAEVEP